MGVYVHVARAVVKGAIGYTIPAAGAALEVVEGVVCLATGNLWGAGACFVAAGVSVIPTGKLFAGIIKNSITGTNAAVEGAKVATNIATYVTAKEISKEVGKHAAKAIAQGACKETVSAAAKVTANLLVKEAVKEAGKTAVKAAAKEAAAKSAISTVGAFFKALLG